MLTTENDMMRRAFMPSVRGEGQTVSRGRIERVMRQHGIRARAPRRYRVCTTES